MLGLIACLLSLPADAASDDLRRGAEAFAISDFEGARQAWVSLAEAGDVEAQFRLGILAFSQDYAEALRWLGLAAGQAHIKAQNALGYAYLNGWGTPANPVAAIRWFYQAARQGYDEAQYNLAACYREGLGTDRNVQAAGHWARKAAQQGHAGAQELLAELLADGMGGQPDLVEALAWRRKAAAQGDGEAALNLGYMYYMGKG
ncbi:MAG: tetratricopeptide repeat protein, partial [Perlucidibaca sp.]